MDFCPHCFNRNLRALRGNYRECLTCGCAFDFTAENLRAHFFRDGSVHELPDTDEECVIIKEPHTGASQVLWLPRNESYERKRAQDG